MLEVREQILQEKGFDDIYVQKKNEENLTALAELPLILNSVDRLKQVSRGNVSRLQIQFSGRC